MEHHRAALPRRKQEVPEEELRALAGAAPPPRDFVAAIRSPGVSLVAECKWASPSKGVLVEDYDPVALASTYERAGAAAISVLTDTPHFQGSLNHLRAVREVVGLPVLRKDFIFDEYQLYESRAAGSDAVLLIASVLSTRELQLLLARTLDLGMTALVEVHNAAEVKRIMGLHPQVVGINNRDLQTFEVDYSRTARLRRQLPHSLPVIGESGVRDAADVTTMRQAGVDAVLVGEALMRSRNVLTAAQRLVAAGQD